MTITTDRPPMADVPESSLLKEPTIPVAEIFGPTIQGEGALAGRPTYFLRVGGCDYACLWCDTAHAVLAEQVRELPRLEQSQICWALLEQVKAHPGPEWLTISGGNPALYDLSEVVAFWQASHEDYDFGKVAVETQGSRFQSWLADVDCLTISPKPPSSEMPRSGDSYDNLRDFMYLLETFRGTDTQYRGQIPNEVLKVVIFDEADYEFARKVHKTYPLVPFYLSAGTAMGGLSGRWVPPAIPDLRNDPSDKLEWDRYLSQRRNPDLGWTPSTYVDPPWYLLRRYKWLVEKAAADPDMADVAVFPQLHALTWGVTTRGV